MLPISRFNVLIIDDNPEFIKSLSRLVLDVAGSNLISVQTSNNVYDGMAMVRDHGFQFIFLNVKMSTIDNILIAKNVAMVNHQSTKIIAISFHTETIFKSQVIRAGATHYMVKDEIDHTSLNHIFTYHNIA